MHVIILEWKIYFRKKVNGWNISLVDEYIPQDNNDGEIIPTVVMEGVVSTISLEGESNDVLLDESLMIVKSLNLELE